MGGTSQSTTQQQSTTQPWQPSQGLLTSILGSAQGYLPQTGITSPQTNALNTIENHANAANRFTPQINGVTANLLAGGGALTQAPMVQSAYGQYGANTAPLANNTNYNPYSTPGFKDAIDTMTSDITNNVNGSFAAAGRDGSGANTQALARGLAQGLAPTIQSQYQNNVTNQQNAAQGLYGAGNTSAALLSGLQQQAVANKQAGVSGVGASLDASNAGSNATLMAEAQRLGIPLQNLGLLANIGTPIAGLGSQSTGQGTTTNQMSGAQQFGLLAGGLGGLFKGLFPGGL